MPTNEEPQPEMQVEHSGLPLCYIVAVFASGRCQVAVVTIAILNLPPEGMQHVERERAAVAETKAELADVRAG